MNKSFLFYRVQHEKRQSQANALCICLQACCACCAPFLETAYSQQECFDGFPECFAPLRSDAHIGGHFMCKHEQ